MSPFEAGIAELSPKQDHAVYFMSDLTKSFMKGTLKILMRALEVDCGALFLFDPVQETLVLESMLGSTTKTFMSLPLFVGGELVGSFKIGTKANGRNFSQKDLRFSGAVCRHACRVVDDQVRFARMRRELDLVAREKKVLEKYCSVGKLATGIVGEINSPLDGALRYTGLMISHIDDSIKEKDYLLDMKKGLERIAEIMSHVSRMGNPVQMQFVDRPVVDIHQLLNEAIDIFSASFKKTVTLNLKFKGPLCVRMDKDIRHVFTNFVKNALDAMASGGELEISTEIKQAGLQICFRDSGSGIALEHQEIIFEPFYTTKPKGSGTGLGLAICREIVGKYGGCIGVKSAPGKGSTFTVLFPRDILVQ